MINKDVAGIIEAVFTNNLLIILNSGHQVYSGRCYEPNLLLEELGYALLTNWKSDRPYGDSISCRLYRSPAKPKHPEPPEWTLKSFREKLCQHYKDMPPDIQKTIDTLIEQIDRHRPLGYDGKHGDRHTPYCGCEDS